MKTQALAALMTLLPGVAAAQVKLMVGIPSVQVSVNGPVGEPPGPDYVWEPARMVNENGRWMQQPGYWRQVAPPPPPVTYDPGYQGYPPPQAGYESYPPPQVVYTEVAPPAPLVEVRPAPPYGGAIWIGGYWNWNHRRYHWVGGRWDRPRHGYAWHAPRWQRQGHRWAVHTGGWRRYGGDRYDRYDRGDRRDRWDRYDRSDRRDRRDNDRRSRYGHHGRDRDGRRH